MAADTVIISCRHELWCWPRVRTATESERQLRLWFPLCPGGRGLSGLDDPGSKRGRCRHCGADRACAETPATIAKDSNTPCSAVASLLVASQSARPYRTDQAPSDQSSARGDMRPRWNPSVSMWSEAFRITRANWLRVTLGSSSIQARTRIPATKSAWRPDLPFLRNPDERPQAWVYRC